MHLTKYKNNQGSLIDVHSQVPLPEIMIQKVSGSRREQEFIGDSDMVVLRLWGTCDLKENIIAIYI